MVGERNLRRLGALLAATLLVAGLAACGGFYGSDGTAYPDDDNRKQTGDSYKPPSGSIFGPSGLTLFSTADDPAQAPGGSGIGVNSFLWRASLDTVAFMPLSSADPFGGVIITDWYSPPETPTERFKVNVFILSRDLRADGVRTTVFKQRQIEGQWADEPVDQTTAVQLENAILTRARQLRIAQL